MQPLDLQRCHLFLHWWAPLTACMQCVAVCYLFPGWCLACGLCAGPPGWRRDVPGGEERDACRASSGTACPGSSSRRRGACQCCRQPGRGSSDRAVPRHRQRQGAAACARADGRGGHWAAGSGECPRRPSHSWCMHAYNRWGCAYASIGSCTSDTHSPARSPMCMSPCQGMPLDPAWR